VEWTKAHPGGVILDIGCSVGIYSVTALFADPRVEVFAIDADLSSLAATRRLCRYASGDRLHVVCGLIGDQRTSDQTINDAIEETSRQLKMACAPRGDPGTTKYICSTSRETGAIPRYSLDQLFSIEKRPGLIKCDVEGAELLVLQGARELLARAVPDILLSVHPPALENDYGHSVVDLQKFLHSAGYKHRVLAVDHEEHWWCSRR
jgi:FkbM family methyltransferase